MAKTSVSKRSYPWTTTLDGKQITLRRMQPCDRHALLAFARKLPADDLLFLSVDITKPDAVDAWARDLETNRAVTVKQIAQSQFWLNPAGTAAENSSDTAH